MFLISKQKILIQNGNEKVLIEPNILKNYPDGISKHPYFQDCVKAGVITVSNTVATKPSIVEPKIEKKVETTEKVEDIDDTK